MIKRVLALLIILFFAQDVSAQPSPIALQNWKDQKYSMFIHFGLYSVLGGVWNGKPVTYGYSEQIESHGGIHSDMYAAVANRFDPVRWNPDSIALLAKAAGMHSVVITSKHHDGFCMFHSRYTDYNIYDATPYHRDVVKELADACRRHGLRFGVYFSLIDWHFPQAYPISSTNCDPITPEHHDYNKKQVTELLTNYGPISEIWFDMGSLTAEQSNELYALVHRLQPDCMVSGRIGNDYGDFCVMGDNAYPDYKLATPWQTPASMYDDTWGYRSWAKRGDPAEKAREKLVSLIKVVSRGGNYLLNIGPRGDGSVVEFEQEVLLKNGAWLKKNGEAIYGAAANPFDTTFTWGEVTSRPGTLYLHILKMPEDHIISLPGLTGKIDKIELLDDHTSTTVRWKQTDKGETIILPASLSNDNDIRVLAVRFKNNFSIRPLHLLQLPAGGLTLNRSNAVEHYSFSGIDYNSFYRSVVARSFTVIPEKSTLYHPALLYTAEEQGKMITLETADHPETITLTDDPAITLTNDTSAITWGPLYLNGPYSSGLGWGNELPENIDPAASWPRRNGKPWALQTPWQYDSVYTMTALPETAIYLLQEISSSKAQPLLIGLTSGDGIQVFLNGEEQAIHNNPERNTAQHELLLLHLQQGKNWLTVKYYNRFGRHTPLSIDRKVPQVLYKKTLPPLQLKKGNLYTFGWQLYHPALPHRDMRLPGLVLQLQP